MPGDFIRRADRRLRTIAEHDDAEHGKTRDANTSRGTESIRRRELSLQVEAWRAHGESNPGLIRERDLS
jgi:hypothetical protein